MAYCTVDDVQPYLTHVTINNTSQPTKEQVSIMCDDVSDNIIDPIIRNYATLPITDKVGLNYLKQGAKYYVISHILRGLYGLTDNTVALEEKFEDFLEKIRTNNSVLVQPNYKMPSVKGSTRSTPRISLAPNSEEVW